MKINKVLLIISAVIAILIAFGVFSANANSAFRVLITVGSGLTILATLCGLLVISSQRPGMANIKVVSAIFLLFFLVVHLIFSFANSDFAPYLVTTGIFVALYVLLCFLITRVVT